MLELLTCLLAGAVIKARQDAYDKYGVFMPAEAYRMVEQCDQLLHEIGYHPDS